MQSPAILAMNHLDLLKSGTRSMIVVSNRLPFTLTKSETGKLSRHASAGGLVTAMAPVVKQLHGVWVGWAGIHVSPDDVMPEGDPDAANAADSLGPEQLRVVNLSPDLFDSYYNGCCNATFWPLMHSMPDRCVFKRAYWNSYSEANKLFADATFNALQSCLETNAEDVPLVWIHDYQLMLTPGLIRTRMEEEDSVPDFKIAFFDHIPFPPWDIFRLLPWDDEILVGLLGCDLVGFHVDGYAENFMACCQKRLGLRVDAEAGLIEHDGRTVRVMSFPIGIPFQQFEEMAKTAPEVIADDGDRKVILGVDRLDYTKGIIHRVKAFENLVDRYPEHKDRVTLLQIAVPSRVDVQEYQDLKDELDREIGRINGRLSSRTWTPIKYIYRFTDQSELSALYRDAFVALVTPIRDGMNLVAKEFVACQIKEPGVLILSPFTGAGQTMDEALLVNPLEQETLADTIHRALTMPKDERELRMSALRRRERQYDVHHWVRSFLSASGAFNGSGASGNKMEPLTIKNFEKWLSKYVGDESKLALLLDYDGTLAPIAKHPDDAKLPDDTRQVLEELSKMPNVYVSVISGRSMANVKAMVNIEGITFAGNHGLDIEHPDGTKFVHPEQAKYAVLMNDLREDLESSACQQGAWIESKGVLLTFHYRNVPPRHRAPLIDQATTVILRHGFRPCKAHCAIEARPPIEWDKGRASIHVLRTTFGVDWSERVRIIYVGDDVTDEDAMCVLKGLALTFRVANSATQTTHATHRLHSTRSVFTLLTWVKQHMEKRQMLA